MMRAYAEFFESINEIWVRLHDAYYPSEISIWMLEGLRDVDDCMYIS